MQIMSVHSISAGVTGFRLLECLWKFWMISYILEYMRRFFLMDK